MGEERREGRVGERRGQERRVGGREGRGKEGGKGKERGGKGEEGGRCPLGGHDAPLTQIPGSAPAGRRYGVVGITTRPWTILYIMTRL